jgi:probable F420-dependent oxidoreductase
MGELTGRPGAFTGRLGLSFPHGALSADAKAVAELGRAAERAGLDYLAVASHDLGVDARVHAQTLSQDWPFPGATGFRGVAYDHTDAFHEPFALCSYLGAVCDLSFLTAVVVLPQRQTVAVAKAAAEVDLLSSGRLVLGVGAGWNSVEMAAVGARYRDRFARMEEQIEVLRLLWTQETVTFTGDYHALPGVALRPMPVQRPIPVWIGSGGGARALARVARLADGWLPQLVPGRGLEDALRIVHRTMGEGGRDPASLAVHGVVTIAGCNTDTVLRRVGAWCSAGATHLALDARGLAAEDLEDALSGAVDAIRNG